MLLLIYDFTLPNLKKCVILFVQFLNVGNLTCSQNQKTTLYRASVDIDETGQLDVLGIKNADACRYISTNKN